MSFLKYRVLCFALPLARPVLNLLRLQQSVARPAGIDKSFATATISLDFNASRKRLCSYSQLFSVSQVSHLWQVICHS